MLGRYLVSALLLVGLAFFAGSGASACHALEPASKPIDTCLKNCAEIAPRSCSDAECERGCEFILDRIVEKESKNVLACVARIPRRCTDVVWADCAVRVGAHADGGPPAPPLPNDDEFQ